jgi:hypothetical protein
VIGCEDRLEYRFRNVANDRHTHAVPTNMIGVIIALGEAVAVVQTHQPCGLSWREKTRPNAFAVYDENRLTGRSTCGGAQASRKIIEPNLSPLTFRPIRLGSRTPINASNHSLCRQLGRSNLRSIDGRHETEKVVRLCG